MPKEILSKSVVLPNGETMGYRETGTEGRVLLLIHGNLSSSKHWDLVMENFPEGYKIFAVDLRGFGNSSYNVPVNSLKDFSEDVRLFADSVGLQKFDLAGWSAGGSVAMQFAADYPRYVGRLILMASVGIKGYPMWKSDENGQILIGERMKTREDVAGDVQILKIANAVASKDRAFLRAVWDNLIYGGNPPSPERYDEYLDVMLLQRNIIDVYYALISFNISNENNGVGDGTGDADKIKMPTLIIQGNEDKVIPVMMAEGTADGIGGDAELVILENSGHSPVTDCLDKVIELFVTFMKA